MDTSSIDIISQRQQARKTQFYESNGDRKSKIPEVATDEKKSTPDYRVNISDEAKNAATSQTSSTATAPSSPNASRLAELRAKSDAVIADRNPVAEPSKAETEAPKEAEGTGDTVTSEEGASEKSQDFISKRQASRQEYFHAGEKTEEFSYDRNSDLDALKAQSDAIMDKYKNPSA
ncbi:MAG: hypothetical protein OCD01_03630 [Fibrobacterales bacterium]